jgi:glucokinase
MNEQSFSIGIDLGGTRIKIGIVLHKQIIAKKVLPANSSTGLKTNLPFILKEINQLIKEQGLSTQSLIGIGLAFPGLVNPCTKKILSTNQKYDDALEIDLGQWVQENWNVPFYLENDARMAAVGEWKYGAAQDTDDLIVVTIGTGIGTSAIINGKLLRGKHFQAGCLGGHFTIRYNGLKCTCGNFGCVEAYGATWSLQQMMEDIGASSNDPTTEYTDFSKLFKAIDLNDLRAKKILKECMDVWAAGIVNLIHAYDPEVVVLGGGAMNRQEIIIPYLTEKVHCHAWTPWGKVQIRPTQLLSNAGILGVTYCLEYPL